MSAQVRRYTARNEQNDLWRRQSLRSAYGQHTAGRAYEQAERTDHLHAITVPQDNGKVANIVVWDCQKNEFFCSEHRMHTCECSGAAIIYLIQRGLHAYMDSREPEEVEANAKVWREANS
jgi:hypothetical protein